MEHKSYQITDADIQAMVSFLMHYVPEAANTITARKILEHMQEDVHNATPEDVIAIYKSIAEKDL